MLSPVSLVPSRVRRDGVDAVDAGTQKRRNGKGSRGSNVRMAGFALVGCPGVARVAEARSVLRCCSTSSFFFCLAVLLIGAVKRVRW
ncbi:hypothetical protein LZ32DRAFT_367736 [Colletotrichum eremochloae]|nr:hypothetical protein LZ32DRAFT_367736 [Colletotrichum eremochloae]